MFHNHLVHKVIFLCTILDISFGERYILKEINNSQEEAKKMLAMSDRECYLEIKKQDKTYKIFGMSFCNHFFGDIQENKIKALGLSMMICSPQDMQNENKILSIINNADIKITSKEIIITNKQQEQLVFQTK